MSYFSRNTTQPLIQNNKDYKVQSHIISIQSEDRDVLKWPNSSEFEVELPVEYKNICAITVLDIQIPNTFYTFTTRKQNTKLILKHLAVVHIITIDEGTYTPEQMVAELTAKINAATTLVTVTVKYNSINKKIYFFSNKEITLDFTIDPFCNIDELNMNDCAVCPIPSSHYARSNRPTNYLTKNTNYSDNCTTTDCLDSTGENRYTKMYNDAYVIKQGPSAYDKSSEWGLGSYLGFNKQEYTSISAGTNSDYAWISSDDYTTLEDSGNSAHVIESNTAVNVCDFDNIFMELDKFNCIDELEPYCFNTNAANQVKYANYRGKKIPICCNNQQPNKTYNGKHNSAFAIIPVGGNVDYTPGDSMISGFYESIPPVPRIKKFKFKFRWHDGNLVNFNSCNINFVLQVQELINNMVQQPNITNINSLVF